jgi:hypothetical protein
LRCCHSPAALRRPAAPQRGRSCRGAGGAAAPRPPPACGPAAQPRLLRRRRLPRLLWSRCARCPRRGRRRRRRQPPEAQSCESAVGAGPEKREVEGVDGPKAVGVSPSGSAASACSAAFRAGTEAWSAGGADHRLQTNAPASASGCGPPTQQPADYGPLAFWQLPGSRRAPVPPPPASAQTTRPGSSRGC